MSLWTAEQILAFAPDPNSARSGQDLAKDRKWVTLGCSDAAVWGECQGSGKLPYQTQVDLSEPAFKCSCPSRKFPCKHGIGLLLLFEKSPAAFASGEPPEWVTAWLASRRDRVERQTRKAEEKPPDPVAQAKRASQREAKVAAGLREFDLWLRDLARNGLADTASKSYAFWDAPASRLVDAQASGIARGVRELAGVAASGPDWQGRMLGRIGRLYLLEQAYGRLETLPAATRADIRALIGWTQNQDELLAGPGVRDRWLIVGQRIADDDRIQTQRTYLIGERTGRTALLLHFAAPGTTLDTSFPPGASFEGEIVYFESAAPLRALVKSRDGAGPPADRIAGEATLQAALRSCGDALARFPWLDRHPLALSEIFVVRSGDDWLVRDGDGGVLPIAPSYANAWRLLAIAGGRPVALLGEWDGEFLFPLGVAADGRFYAV